MKFGKKTLNRLRAIMPLKVIQGHRGRYTNRKPVCDLVLVTDILSRAVSQLSQRIVQILDTAFLSHLLGAN